MPVPIIPQNVNSLFRKEKEMQMSITEYDKMDFENIGRFMEKRKNVQEIVKVVNFEAGLLFRLWKDSRGEDPEGEILIPPTFSNDDVIRLKASGLISGDTEKFKFTSRGKDVIKTMVLSEKNAFDKNSSDKTYEQRLSETVIHGGPRLAVGNKK